MKPDVRIIYAARASGMAALEHYTANEHALVSELEAEGACHAELTQRLAEARLEIARLRATLAAIGTMVRQAGVE
jgi:uncharacterized small protein (DUF1192 family)